MPKEQRALKDSFVKIVFMLATVGGVQLVCSHAQDLSFLSLILLSTLIALPIWFYKIEYSLFARRAILTAGGQDGSIIKRVLWQGQLSKAFSLLVSFTFAILLISFGSLFEPEYWLIIYVDVFIISLIMHFSSHIIEDESNAEAQGIFHRRFAHGTNLIIIVFATSFFDFYFIGAPDLRGMDWHIIFQNELNYYTTTSANEWLGWIIGVKSGIDSLAWYLMQVYIPEIHSLTVKIIAWSLFLIPTAISVSFILFVLLGCLTILDHKEKKDWKLLGETVSSKSFMAALLLLASFYFYGTYAIATTDWSKVIQSANTQLSKIDFCDRESISKNQRNITLTLNSQIDRKTQVTEEEINQLIQEKLSPIFAFAEQGVDSYLDWYYSVSGEYFRLYVAGKSLATDSNEYITMMSNKTQQYLFDETGVSKQIEALDFEATNIVKQHLLNPYQLLLSEDYCTLKSTTASAHSFEGNFNTAGAMAPVTLLRLSGKGVSKRIATAIAGKALAKGATKMVAKKAVSGGAVWAGVAMGATLGAAGGPVLAFAGGFGGALAVWFGVDIAFITTEEHFYRDGMRSEMMVTIEEQRVILEQQLKEKYAYQVQLISNQLQGVVTDTFIPARDGL
ncbi:MAG: hypothetical protein V7717_05365 [Porticoccaceae bacterium]